MVVLMVFKIPDGIVPANQDKAVFIRIFKIYFRCFRCLQCLFTVFRVY